MIDDEEARSFFEFLISNRAGNDFTTDLKDYVTDAKHNMQWRLQFMTWERQRAYDFDDGMAAGMQKKAVEDALNMLKINLGTPQQISQITGLPLEEVMKLAEEIKAVEA